MADHSRKKKSQKLRMAEHRGKFTLVPPKLQTPENQFSSHVCAEDAECCTMELTSVKRYSASLIFACTSILPFGPFPGTICHDPVAAMPVRNEHFG